MENPAINPSASSNLSYHWEAEPKRRGTVGIISLCFSTLIICIWSTLHFSIPIRRYNVARRLFLHVFWMFIALLAPEGLLLLAVNERFKAGALVEKMREFHPRLVKPGVLDRMFSWICRRAGSKGKRYKLIEQTPQPHFGLAHAFYAGMGGFAFYASFDDGTPESLFEISTNPRCPVEIPDAGALKYIMKHFPHIITDITEDYILDQAASSGLSKALLIVQVAWFCTNCSSRLIQDLPLSLLEVSTVAHAFCTLLTYFVWWSKPINVAQPTILREKGAREVHALFKCSDDEYDKALEMARKRKAGDSSMSTGPHISKKIVLAAGALHHLLSHHHLSDLPPRPSGFRNRDDRMIPGDVFIKSDREYFSVFMFLAFSTMLYGLAHFLARGDQFPTPLERLLWRAASIVVTCSGFAEALMVFYSIWLERKRKFTDRSFIALMVSIFLVIPPITHLFGSSFLLVESVRQLFFLRDAVYKVPSWSNYRQYFS